MILLRSLIKPAQTLPGAENSFHLLQILAATMIYTWLRSTQMVFLIQLILFTQQIPVTLQLQTQVMISSEAGPQTEAYLSLRGLPVTFGSLMLRFSMLTA